MSSSHFISLEVFTNQLIFRQPFSSSTQVTFIIEILLFFSWTKFRRHFYRLFNLSLMILKSSSVTASKNKSKAFLIIGITDFLILLSNNRIPVPYSSFIPQSSSILFISYTTGPHVFKQFSLSWSMQYFSTFFPPSAVLANLNPMFLKSNFHGLRSIINAISNSDCVRVTSFIFRNIEFLLCLRVSTIVVKINRCSCAKVDILQENRVTVTQTITHK